MRAPTQAITSERLQGEQPAGRVGTWNSPFSPARKTFLKVVPLRLACRTRPRLRDSCLVSSWCLTPGPSAAGSTPSCKLSLMLLQQRGVVRLAPSPVSPCTPRSRRAAMCSAFWLGSECGQLGGVSRMAVSPQPLFCRWRRSPTRPGRPRCMPFGTRNWPSFRQEP